MDESDNRPDSNDSKMESLNCLSTCKPLGNELNQNNNLVLAKKYIDYVNQ